MENKPGASGNIGTDFVAKSAPDGYTLMVTVNTFTITPSLIKNTPYNIVEDFAPISKIATATYIVTAVAAMLFNYLGYHSVIVDLGVWLSLAITLVSAFHYIWHARRIIDAQTS